VAKGAKAAKSILLADLGAVGFVDAVEAASGKAKSVACRLVSPDAFWATRNRTCWAGWSCGVVVEGVGDDRRSDWSSCGCAAQVGECANLGRPRLAMMETLRGSGAFCHWEARLAWHAASGKRLLTPSGRAVACRFVSPDAFLATQDRTCWAG
jgi:hypothetical protein